MAQARARGRPRGGALLTRERVLRSALNLADQVGIDDLTMRRVAADLGVDAMSLYNHLVNKTDLLDGLVDLVFEEIELPAGKGDWRAKLRRWARSVRHALSRHRWAIGLMESRTQPGPANLRHHDAVLGCLREGGFSVRAAVHAFSLLDSFIYGFALQEMSLPFESSEQAVEVTADILKEFRPGDYPHLAEVGRAHVARGYRYADEFEVGLNAILGALEGIRRSA